MEIWQENLLEKWHLSLFLTMATTMRKNADWLTKLKLPSHSTQISANFQIVDNITNVIDHVNKPKICIKTAIKNYNYQ